MPGFAQQHPEDVARNALNKK